MLTTPAMMFDAPIIGTDGGDFISVETSVSFQWMPAAGNAYFGSWSQMNFDDTTGDSYWQTTSETGPSHAGGSVTFDGVTSDEPFRASPVDGSFWFTGGSGTDLSGSTASWTYNPATGVLNPHDLYFSWDDWIGVHFSATEADMGTSHWDGSTSDTEYGHWQLVPQIHNVSVYGGGGNDIIVGGQGTEMLYGGAGDDLFRASIGNDLVYGGAGDDELHGSTGEQSLMGDAGNDTIWAGTGMGGAGSDMLWGGSGPQVLQGGDGSDILYAGSGNETLSGGSGSDTFVFSAANGDDIITDFHLGQDIIRIAAGFGGLALTKPIDLLAHISADAPGDAVLSLGGGLRVVLQQISADRVEMHPAAFFRVS
jgi:RTX calcium-binding nonapeptide repeat (4 copies)